jgi:hypothetical protein
MAIQWSGLGPELLLRLGRCAPSRCAPSRCAPSWKRARARRSGADGWPRASGCTLPELVREPGISRGPAQEGYSQLPPEGYLTSQAKPRTRLP